MAGSSRNPVLINRGHQRFFVTVNNVVNGIAGRRRAHIVVKSPGHKGWYCDSPRKINHIVVAQSVAFFWGIHARVSRK